jgi:hypothetical protein
MFEKRDETTVPVSSVKLDLESQKKNIAENLRECSDNIKGRIQVIDEKMDNADDDLKRSLRECRTKLVKEKKRVDKSLNEVERSSEDTWKVVNKKASITLTDARIQTQKIEERVEDLID